MLKRIIVLAFPVVLAWCGLAPAARAAVDTFSFSTSGWGHSSLSLSGQFSGTVEPDGLIELTDLTAFQATVFDGVVTMDFGTGDLSLFSYDPAGGASTLDLIATKPLFLTTACVGAASTLSLTCNTFGANPASARAVILEDLILFDFTSIPPTITLVTAPEPSTWAMTLLGFASLGCAGYRGRKSAAAVA